MKKLFVVIMIFASCTIAFGAERLFYEGFEGGNLNYVQKGTGVSINSNEQYSGKYCAKVEFAPKYDGNQMIIKRITSGISNEVYIKYWIKLDPSWPADAYPKPFRANVNYTGPTLSVWAGGAGTISGQMNTMDGLFMRLIHTNASVGSSSVAPNWLGNWTKVEIYLKKNSAVGVYNGVYKLWWNGVLIYNDSTMHPTSADGKFYDTFYFPSNMNCDLARLSVCSNWNQTTPFYLFIDDIEIWNGMPSTSGQTASELKTPTGLVVK